MKVVPPVLGLREFNAVEVTVTTSSYLHYAELRHAKGAVSGDRRTDCYNLRLSETITVYCTIITEISGYDGNNAKGSDQGQVSS